MATDTTTRPTITPEDLFVPADATAAPRPIWLANGQAEAQAIADLTPEQRTWIAASGFAGQPGRHVVVLAADGTPAGVVLGIGDGEPGASSLLLTGALPSNLPAGVYRLAGDHPDGKLAAIAWGLGAYRFQRYKAASEHNPPRLLLPAGVDMREVINTIEAIWLARDLINTPASDMGPAELEAAARSVASGHGAEFSSVVGDDLLRQNFPMIHAVGRASPRAPRLIDFTWGRVGAPKVTLTGKGICFDTGGLDIKPAAGMLIMKKDMGGAAAVLALAHMIMGQRLDVRLRVIIPAAENSISGNALRPGDVLASRAGQTVEIGNTDAEGRLVLADALALADEESPDLLLSFATLTGAARVALGPDLPPLYCDDDALARDFQAAGQRVGDPVWRMPFWSGYERNLDSEVADMNNVSESPFAGSVIAALFLRRFVRQARRFAHLDIYGWRPAPRPLGPKGGEPNAARAAVEVIKSMATGRAG